MKRVTLAVALASLVLLVPLWKGQRTVSEASAADDAARDAVQLNARIQEVEKLNKQLEAKLKDKASELEQARTAWEKEKKVLEDKAASALADKAKELSDMTADRDSYRGQKYVIHIYSHPNKAQHHATVDGLYIPDTAKVCDPGGYYFDKDDGPHCIFVEVKR